LGIKTRTWQGAATGAVGGAILGGVACVATCWG
ncbi:ComC/BlpC family peptide pheromone/bacteriocin, partial [Streptococcus pneumoniae]